MASMRASGLAERRAAVERERLAVDRLPDDAPVRDEPERADVDRDELDRDELEEDRGLELLREPEPEREVLRPLELPPLARVLRERVEPEDDEPEDDDRELLEPEEPLELEAPRLGCGIDLSPCDWGQFGGVPRHPTVSPLEAASSGDRRRPALT